MLIREFSASAEDSRESSFGVSVNAVGYMVPYDFLVQNRKTDNSVLIYCIDGRGKVFLGQDEFRVSSGDVVVLPAHISHSIQSRRSDKWELWWIEFSGTWAGELVSQLGFSEKSPRINVGYLDDIEQHCLSIFKLLGHKHLHYGVDSAVEMIALLAGIKKNRVRLSQDQRALINSMDYRTQGVDECAKRAGCSKYHFIRRFKRETGVTPWAYILNLKIGKARELLMSQENSIKSISAEIGFNDPNYFSRIFSKSTGMSPTEFRKQHEL